MPVDRKRLERQRLQQCTVYSVQGMNIGGQVIGQKKFNCKAKRTVRQLSDICY